MSFKRYPAYKDSGVEWLGDIPSHWSVIPLAKIALEPGSLFIDGDWVESKDLSDQGIRYITTGNVGEGKYKEQGSGYISQAKFDELRCTEVLPGDVLISRLNLPIGRACVVPDLGERIITSVDNVITRPDSGYSCSYLAYMLSSASHFANMEVLARGTTMQRISRSTLGQVRFSFPPLDEQTAIATFLDHETAKIDALVAEQEKLITLLQEKRQAVISHAVAKGLNPNAPMKDSGIEWLGEVPAHWDVRALKNIVSTPITDGPHETPQFLDEGVPFVSAEAVSQGFINFEKIRGHISAEDHQRYSQKYLPRRGDVYMVKSGATTGVTAIVETDQEFNIWSPLAALRCGDKMLPKFLLHYMRSRHFQEAVTLNWSFGTQQNIGMGVIGNLSAPVPPLEEQTVIAFLLDQETAKLDTLTAEARTAITLLQERRTSLISAAVTGQIDVRNWSVSESA